MKDGVKQFAILLIYGLILFVGMRVQDELYLYAGRTYKPFPSFLFSVAFPIIFGLTLGVSNYLNERKKDGKWSIDGSKLVFACIPTLFVGLSPILRWYPPFNQLSFLNLFLSKSGFISQLTYISGIAFGYFLICSLQKSLSVKKNEVQSLNKQV